MAEILPPPEPVYEYQFEVWQNAAEDWCEYCAGGGGMDIESLLSEANHYALMYGQDGPVKVRWFKRIEIPEPPEAESDN
jgi:hypothetical protein